MNFTFYIFGTPNNYNQYPSDAYKELFGELVENPQSEVQLIIRRVDKLIYYIYLRHGLLSKVGHEGAFLGMSIVLNGVFLMDVKGIKRLFDNLYFSMASKGEIIKEDKKGQMGFSVNRFIDKHSVIEECMASLRKGIENQINSDYIEAGTSFNHSELNVKTLSINDSTSDIFDAVNKFRYVVLSSPELYISKTKDPKKKWTLPLIFMVIAIFIGTIIMVKRNGNDQTSDLVIIQHDINYPIAGKYLCNIYYPKEAKFKIEIFSDSIANKHYGLFINYGYRDTLFDSEFIVNANNSEVSNATLGVGTIIRNSFGEIEIISKSENEIQWNMRKIR